MRISWEQPTNGLHLRFVATCVLFAQVALANTLDDIYRFGPLGPRLKADELQTISRVAADEHGGPWAVFASYSQVLPETWYVDAFLPPTVSTSTFRRGTVRHLECRPQKTGTCLDWRPRPEPTAQRYVQVADGPAFGDAVTVRRPWERPIQVEGELSDRDLVSLISYVRSKPTPKSAAGVFVPGISTKHPIISVARLKDGSVWVRFSETGGSGETATVIKTDKGWQVTKVVVWVA